MTNLEREELLYLLQMFYIASTSIEARRPFTKRELYYLKRIQDFEESLACNREE